MADCIPNTPFAFNGGGNRIGGGGGSPNEADVNDENRKLFLGGLSWETDEQDLLEYFGKFGEVDKVTIKYDNITRRSRGFGFVTFINPDTVESVLGGGPHFIKNRAVDPKRPKGKTGLKKIFVGGINGDLTKEEIKGYFEKFGAIEHIERPFDRQRNRSRDFCFVIFETDEAAESAISSPKQVIGGKECDIKIAHPQRNNMQGNGNGFGGPGGPGLGGRGGQGGGPGGRGQPGFFKGRNPNVAGNGGGAGNWRSNERGGPGGNFRGSGSHDDRFADTQFLTNIDSIPNNGYSGYKTYTNSNFFPNYWN